MEDNNKPSETQDDGTQLMSPSVEENVSVNIANEQPSPVLSLEQLNSLLGKNFKDIETAQKSIKELNSYVGKKKEDIEVETKKQFEATARELAEIKKNMFYDKNPDYKEYRSLIEKIGSNPEDVVRSPEFKLVYEKAANYDKSQNFKTVLESNSRVTQTRETFKKADELMAAGKKDQAQDLVVNEILKNL